jgi:ABC-type sugar transport system ATPase subunit
MSLDIRLDTITKAFGATVALDRVSLSITRGECHALMGENGAGKSTLGKILAGIHRPDSGRILLDGQPCRFATPREARQAGVGMVHQELAFCPDLTVAENLSLGRYPRRGGIFLNRKMMNRRAEGLLRDIAPEIEVETTMRNLAVAHHQLVQIAAAVGTGARVLIFDEPTSALSETESGRLFRLIDALRSRGVTIVYISHRFPEVFRIADRISVLRDGTEVGTVRRQEATQDSIIQMMIGRQISDYFPRHPDAVPGEEILRVQGLTSPEGFRDITFSVRAGEIIGIAGLVGSGRSEVAHALFGLDRHARGSILFRGTEIQRRPLRERMRMGLALVPEDRKRQGLALVLSCRINFSLPILDLLRRFLFVNRKQETRTLDLYFRRLSIKAASYDSAASSLSGGNQQKIVLAKWLAREAHLLILDEPTRGIDVGAKAAIHGLIDDLASQGMGIILISSELPEILNLSTRILVMREGRIVGEVQRPEATQEHLLTLMSGLTQN